MDCIYDLRKLTGPGKIILNCTGALLYPLPPEKPYGGNLP